ncbi:MAG TPA: four helix bundle protein [Terriglobia bacterium]|nr:four helix bundle protein [Terriglobia bacterium]
MRYQRFEDLPVWKSAIQLAAGIFALTEKPEFEKRHSIRDQIERAATSVSNNVAEGFERGTNQELLTFLYIARGSVGEVRSMLYLFSAIPGFRNLESEIRNLRAKTDSISRQLGAWARSLQDSELKGRRYVTQKTRQRSEQMRQREEFLRELDALRNKSSPAE